MVNYGLEEPGFESQYNVSAADAASHSVCAEALS